MNQQILTACHDNNNMNMPCMTKEVKATVLLEASQTEERQLICVFHQIWLCAINLTQLSNWTLT